MGRSGIKKQQQQQQKKTSLSFKDFKIQWTKTCP